MKHPILLKRFKYSIPDSNVDVKGMDRRNSRSSRMHLPLMRVDIDFEKRNLSLDGNDLLKMISARKPELVRSEYDKERILVKATIYPGFSIDLADFANDEVAFSLEGIIDDGKSINSCSGLLVLGSTIGRNRREDREWYLKVYLYDDYNDERVIKIKLSMYSISEMQRSINSKNFLWQTGNNTPKVLFPFLQIVFCGRGVFFSFCGNKNQSGAAKGNSATSQAEAKSYGVITVAPRKTVIYSNFPLPSRGSRMWRSAQIDGYMEALYVDEGSVVKKGQLFPYQRPTVRTGRSYGGGQHTNSQADLNAAQMMVNKVQPLVEKILSVNTTAIRTVYLQSKQAALAQATAALIKHAPI